MPSEADRLLAARRMCRDFLPDPLAPDDVAALLDAALGAPAAGNTWGLDLLVLEGPDVGRYWDVTLPAADRASFSWPGLLRAPLLVLPYVDAGAYVARYALPDKARSGLGTRPDDWSVPYWWVDGGAAVMALLVAAQGRRLGALFFGQFEHEPAVAAAFDVPDGRRALGTVAVGRPAHGDRVPASARRGRPDPRAHVHRSRW
ncbi:MAG: nitroreductase family protein [Actinomycetes bacterium]